MANEKTQAELDAQIDAGIKVNGNREITPPIHNAIEKAIVNSSLNKKGGGILQALAFYNSAFSLTDPLSLVYKSYVDDLITALKAITQGTNILTENFNIYTDDHDLLIQSGEEGGTDPRSQFGLSASAASLSYLVGDVVNSVNVDNLSVNLSHADAGTPSNDSAIGCVDGKVSVVGDIEITDVTKGIIMTDQDGSGNRYRITILGASFNLELLP